MPYKILVGHFLGGVLALHALLTAPDMFQAYLAIDVSFWWDNFLLNHKLERRNKADELIGTLYLALANHTTHDKRDFEGMDKPARAFATLLEAFTSPKFRFLLQDFKDDDHGSVPLQSLYHGLLYIFEGYKPPRNVIDSPSLLAEHFEKVSERLGRKIQPPERFTNILGEVVFEEFQDIDRAIEFFKLNVANYPTSPNVYASLAKAHEMKGEIQLAINNFEESLELNPENQSVKEQLQKLQAERN